MACAITEKTIDRSISGEIHSLRCRFRLRSNLKFLFHYSLVTFFLNYMNSTCPMSLLLNRSVYRSNERVFYFVSKFSFEIPTNFLGNVHLLEAGYYFFNDIYHTRRLDALSERHWLTYRSLSLAHWLQQTRIQ